MVGLPTKKPCKNHPSVLFCGRHATAKVHASGKALLQVCLSCGHKAGTLDAVRVAFHLRCSPPHNRIESCALKVPRHFFLTNHSTPTTCASKNAGQTDFDAVCGVVDRGILVAWLE